MFADYFSQDLKEDEEVVVIFRKNWGSQLFSIVKIILFFAILLVLSFWLLRNWVGGAIFILLLLTAIFYVFYVWLNWYFDSVVVTNQRIIKIGQRGLFNREVIELRLDHLRDVSYSIPGFWATIFNYGTVNIEMDNNKITPLDCLSEPKKTQDLLVELGRLANKKISAQELIEFVSRVKWDIFKPGSGVKKLDKLGGQKIKY